MRSRPGFQPEAAGGTALLLAAIAAIVLANSPFAPYYNMLLSVRGTVLIDGFGVDKPALLWINDGQMAVFFLLVGLEIKRDVLAGELRDPGRALLPVAAAIGGMIVPTAIYLVLTWKAPYARPGWAAPAATDIAFSLGVLSLLGWRVAPSLKLFLATLAIIDDLGAIAIIAIFYVGSLSWISLGAAGLALAVLFALNLAGVQRISGYVVIGVILWLFVLKSGVHATLAGVALALAIPYRAPPGGTSALLRLEHELRPWVMFGVLPLFGFANAGVSFGGISLSSLLEPIPLGIAGGLFFGKQLGVFSAVMLVVHRGWAALPSGVSWQAMYGASVLTGIGFTMSFFIGTLAFGDTPYEPAMRLGVLLGSVLSGTVGVVILLLDGARRPAAAQGGPG
jgi:NhaA family Na+:H+ antiporter